MNFQNKQPTLKTPSLLSSLQASQISAHLRSSVAKGIIGTPMHFITSRGWQSSSSPYLFAEPQESNRISLSPQAASSIHTAGSERDTTRWQSSEARFGLECKISTLFVCLSVANWMDWYFFWPWLSFRDVLRAASKLQSFYFSLSCTPTSFFFFFNLTE